jgi:hypothetical protein
VVRENSAAYYLSSGATVDPRTVRGSLRAAAAVVLLGGLSLGTGIFRPITFEMFALTADRAHKIAIAVSKPSEFTLAWALMGIGFILMGLGLGLWGWNAAGLESGHRAVVTRVLAVVVTIGGLMWGMVRLVTPFVSLEQAAVEEGALQILIGVGALGLIIGFVGLGVLTWRGPAPRWVGVFLALMGLLVIPGAIPAWFILGALVFGLVGVIHFRRSWPR